MLYITVDNLIVNFFAKCYLKFRWNISDLSNAK